MMDIVVTWSHLLIFTLLGLTTVQATGSGRNYQNNKPAELSDEELWRNGWEEAWHKVYNNPKAREQFKLWQNAYAKEDGIEIPDFTCDWDVAPGNNKAESVNELRPNDIHVIGALGDSITAAFGVGSDSPGTLTQENRGESWTMGRNDDIETVLTIPNLIRKFNPNVFGASWSRPPVSCTEGLNCTQLNVAISGATNRGIPGQMDNLIEKMQDYDSQGLMSIADDWKMVSIFVGTNDLCRFCINPNNTNPVSYVSSIKEAVNNLRAQVPRVLVNMVIMYDITPFGDIEADAEEFPAFCRTMLQVSCPCAQEPDNELRSTQMEYYNLLNEWINVNGTYDGDNDFTVVLQTQMRDQKPAYDDDGFFDLTYFAPDCFHPSRKMHQTMALNLWNTMLTPVQDKGFDTPQEGPLEFKCPSEESPYIFTNLNSKAIKKAVPQLMAAKKNSHNKDQKHGEHNSSTNTHTNPKHNASSKKQHASSSSSSSSTNQQHNQVAVVAVMGTMLASVLVAALFAGVILPKWRKYQAGKATTAPQHFDNPAYLTEHLN